MRYVNVKDQDLRFALSQIVGDDLTDEALAKVTALDWNEYRAEAGERWEPIYDLAGIEHCVNLQKLFLDGNGVKSLSPLRGLTRLEEVWLVQNQVVSLAPLAGLTALKTLNLERNSKLKSVGPLAGLPCLEWLDIDGTAVTNLSPLGEIASLKRLDWRPPKGISASALKQADAVLDSLRARGVTIGG